MLLFKEPPDVRLLLTSHEPEMVSRVERRLVKKSYRLKRREEARQILFPPHSHHLLFHQPAAARRCFSHQGNKEGIVPSRRNQAAVRLFVLRMEFTLQIRGPGWKGQSQRD